MNRRELSRYALRVDEFDPGVEDEIAIGDLTMCVYRFNSSRGIFGPIDRPNEEVAIKISAFTDVMSTWRRLDRMRVFHKIERANLRSSDDLARLLVGCGLKHVPYAGYEYARDAGAAEKRRIKEVHS